MLDTGVIAAVLTGLVSLVYFLGSAYSSDARRTRRVLRRTRVTPIAKLVDGELACIVGTVELEPDTAALTAMITHQRCVAYDTTIQIFRGNDFSVPERVDVTRKLVPFVVTDATGSIRIDAPQAALCNKPAARSERFEERVIAPGARIRIVGSVRLEPERTTSSEHSYREGATRATLTGTAKYPLLIDVED